MVEREEKNLKIWQKKSKVIFSGQSLKDNVYCCLLFLEVNASIVCNVFKTVLESVYIYKHLLSGGGGQTILSYCLDQHNILSHNGAWMLKEYDSFQRDMILNHSPYHPHLIFFYR